MSAASDLHLKQHLEQIKGSRCFEVNTEYICSEIPGIPLERRYKRVSASLNFPSRESDDMKLNEHDVVMFETKVPEEELGNVATYRPSMGLRLCSSQRNKR
jgi:hypothetical protein